MQIAWNGNIDKEKSDQLTQMKKKTYTDEPESKNWS